MALRHLLYATFGATLLLGCETTPMPGDRQPPTITILADKGVGPISTDETVAMQGCRPRISRENGEVESFIQYIPARAANRWLADNYDAPLVLTQAQVDRAYLFGAVGLPAQLSIIARDNGPMLTMTTGILVDPGGTDIFQADFGMDPDSRSATNTTSLFDYDFYEERGYTSEYFPSALPAELMAGYETHPSHFDDDAAPIPIDGLLLQFNGIENLDAVLPYIFVRAVDAEANATQLEVIFLDVSMCIDRPG